MLAGLESAFRRYESGYLFVRITAGLLRDQKSKANSHRSIANAHQLFLTVQSVTPCTEFGGLAKELDAIAPCGIAHGEDKPSFALAHGRRILPGKHVKVSAITGNVPDAVWGKSEKEGLVLLPRSRREKRLRPLLVSASSASLRSGRWPPHDTSREV